MRVEQEKVKQFMERIDYPTAQAPTLVELDLAQDRYNMTAEELDEYLQAVAAHDLVAVADALADALYLILGTANVHGIDLQPVFDEVHRSNMTKTPMDSVMRPKRCMKGPSYRPPDLAPILLAQTESFKQVIDEVQP